MPTRPPNRLKLFAAFLLAALLPTLGASQSLQNVHLMPNWVVGGNSVTGTVEINQKATGSGFTVNLSSNEAFVQVPASVTVAAGARVASFTATTSAVASESGAAVSASDQGGHTASTGLTVAAVLLNKLSLSPEKVQGGLPSTGTVWLSHNATAGGFLVTLSSSQTTAQVPASVTVAAGTNSATFTVHTSAVTSQSSATISGLDPHGTTAAALLTLKPSTTTARLTSLTLSPDAVVGGATSTGTVNLSGNAPSGGMTITLTSSQSFAQAPTSVSVPSGSSTATFTVTTSAVTAESSAQISGTDPAGHTASHQLRVKQATSVHVQMLYLSPDTITGGNTSTATVALSAAAPPGGMNLTLASDKSFAQVPATLTIPAGSRSGTFSVTTNLVAQDGAANITATDPGNQAASHLLTVKAIKLMRLALGPDGVLGGSSATGTVTLNADAPTGGVTIQLSSSEDFAQVATSVTVAAGTHQATFTVTTSVVTARSVATITGTDPNNVQASAKLNVRPHTLAVRGGPWARPKIGLFAHLA